MTTEERLACLEEQVGILLVDYHKRDSIQKIRRHLSNSERAPKSPVEGSIAGALPDVPLSGSYEHEDTPF